MKLGILLCLGLLQGLVAAARKKRHILLIVADDLGWADVSWADYPQIPTPNLQKLKEDGTELMQFYSQPKCTAARAALMSGRYPYHIGVQTSNVFTRYKNHTLDLNLTLMPQYLKNMGYATHIVGKWHLGYCAKAATPTARGFDTMFGIWENTKSNFYHGSPKGFDWHWNRNGNYETYWEANGTYNTHLITDHTQLLLNEHFKSPDTAKTPLFIYTAFLAPHKPAEVPPEYEQDPLCQKFNATDVRRTYCGMVKALDEGVGKIVGTLKELGVFKDFLIVFTSDNGAAANVGASSWPLRGHKQTVYEGGTRIRTIMHGPKVLGKKAPKQYHGLVHVTDLLPTLYAVAAGKDKDLPRDLDGRNVLWNIKRDKPSGRTWMVYNIDKARRLGAIRFTNGSHNFKLIHRKKSWHRDPRAEVNKTDDRNERVPCPKNGYRFFNLDTNPNELEPAHSPDAALENVEMFTIMKKRLRRFQKEEVVIPTYVTLGRLGPGRPWNNDGSFQIGDCEYNTQIAADRA